jgi:geranyl-CoA carboxylase beta subunit
MTVLETSLDTSSQSFAANRAAMLELIDEFRGLEQKVRDNSARRIDRFHERGQLMPRERIALLLDRGAPWVELSTLAGYKMHDDDGARNIAGGNSLIGVGFVSGVRCLINCSDSGIKGGSITPMGLRKHLRSFEIAHKNKLPVINLIESAGANLLYQSEIFVDGGRIFANMARLSAAGLPIITVVHGSSTAGGAYMPGMSDYTIMVRGRAKVFLGGPPLVKAATGEVASDEELGGAEMHAQLTGTADYLAEDDADAVAKAREVVARLNWNRDARPAPGRTFDDPLYDIDDLCGLVPVDYRKPYEVRELIARLVDGSDFTDFKPGFGPNTVCGHAEIEGRPCGILGNNGPIMPEDAVKAAQFIQLCSQSDTPLVFLQNTTGYMVGLEAESKGMVKHGSRMIQAVANAPVAKITLMTGGSFGAGNYGMCGRGFDPQFIFSWPNSKIAVMGGEQAATVMEIVTRGKFARTDREIDEAAVAAMRDDIIRRTEQESGALFATARIWDDGLMDPRDSRRILAFALAVCREAEVRTPHPISFGVARG